MATSQNPLKEACSDLRRRLRRLTRAGNASPGLDKIISMWTDRLEHSGELYASYPLHVQRDRAPRIRNSFLQLEALVRRVEGKDPVGDREISKVFREAASKILGNKVGVELVVVKSPISKKSLVSTFDTQQDQLTFVLFLSPVIDFSKRSLLPRVVHEAAHAEPRVLALIEELWEYSRKLGELCCDLLATMVAGPIFLRSTQVLVQVIGPDEARKATPTHPSFAGRISILQSVASELWSSATLIEVAAEALGPVSGIPWGREESDTLERLRGDTLGLIPTFIHTAVGEDVWKGVYDGTNSVRQGSILVGLNVEAARTRVRQ